jgi:mono/diheme cytochrome c family protein
MDSINLGNRVPLLAAGGLLGLGLLLGWYWLGRGPAAGSADAQATGKKVFAAHCIRCHTAGGPGADKPRGSLEPPDLGTVGADPSHTRQWFLDTVRDPQAQNRRARMPKFEGKISEGDLLALADYLASLGGTQPAAVADGG